MAAKSMEADKPEDMPQLTSPVAPKPKVEPEDVPSPLPEPEMDPTPAKPASMVSKAKTEAIKKVLEMKEDVEKPAVKKPTAEEAEKEARGEALEKKYDGGSKYDGKFPMTKFYGDRPVVVYYVPIIADTTGKGLEKLEEVPGTKSLTKTIKKKLAKLERKTKD